LCSIQEPVAWKLESFAFQKSQNLLFIVIKLLFLIDLDKCINYSNSRLYCLLSLRNILWNVKKQQLKINLKNEFLNFVKIECLYLK